MADGIEPPKKKQKLQPRKPVHHLQLFLAEYSIMHLCVVKSRTIANHVFCTVCSSDINISHGGIGDVSRLVGTTKHKENAKRLSQTPKITSVFSKSTDSSAIKAEVLFTKFIDLNYKNPDSSN